MPTLPTTPEREIESRPQRAGKSTLVNNAFISATKAGEAVVYEHKDYVCYSRKALENLLQAQATELLGEVEKMIGEDEVTIDKTQAYSPTWGTRSEQIINGFRNEMRIKLASLRSKWEGKIIMKNKFTEQETRELFIDSGVDADNGMEYLNGLADENEMYDLSDIMRFINR